MAMQCFTPTIRAVVREPLPIQDVVDPPEKRLAVPQVRSADVQLLRERRLAAEGAQVVHRGLDRRVHADRKILLFVFRLVWHRPTSSPRACVAHGNGPRPSPCREESRIPHRL